MEGLSAYTEKQTLKQGETVWKVGNEIIYNHPQSGTENSLALQHQQAIKSAKVQIDKVHILFEYVLYLIMKKDVEAAKETLTFYRLYMKRNIAQINSWMPVFEGYLGLLHYISWKELQFSPNTYATVSEEERSLKTNAAEQALEHFGNALNDTPRILDTFIAKQIEILRSIRCPEEEEKVVEKYAELNPRNPNAIKYHYEYLLHYPEATDNEIRRSQILSMLHEVAPSEVYMVDFHKLLLEKSLRLKFINGEDGEFVSEVTSAVRILMDFLDYDARMHNLEGWKNLASCLNKILKTCDDNTVAKLVKAVWQDSRRNTWWPKYHFTDYRAEQSYAEDIKLAVAKSVVAAFFLSKRCQFRLYVKRRVKHYTRIVTNVIS